MYQGEGFFIPDHFQAKEKLMAFSPTLKLLSDGKQFGRLTQRVLTIGNKFEFEDSKGNVLARANQKILSIGTHLEVEDANGVKIGSIDHQTIKSLTSFYDKYEIRDAKGSVIGETEQLDLIRTSVEIYDHNHNKIGVIKKDHINILRDGWEISFFGNIDRRILIFIPIMVSNLQKTI